MRTAGLSPAWAIWWLSNIPSMNEWMRCSHMQKPWIHVPVFSLKKKRKRNNLPPFNPNFSLVFALFPKIRNTINLYIWVKHNKIKLDLRWQRNCSILWSMNSMVEFDFDIQSIFFISLHVLICKLNC